MCTKATDSIVLQNLSLFDYVSLSFLLSVFNTPALFDQVDATPEHRQGDDAEKNLEIKHLQQLLVDNNEKVEQQKQEIKELREALENERTLFAEQLKARAAKEMEWKSSTESLSNEVSMREKRELMNMIASLEQRLIEKDRSESELRDENWRLVNLLKDSNEEMFTEKESLQEQLVKQEEIVMVCTLIIQVRRPIKLSLIRTISGE